MGSRNRRKRDRQRREIQRRREERLASAKAELAALPSTADGLARATCFDCLIRYATQLPVSGFFAMGVSPDAEPSAGSVWKIPCPLCGRVWPVENATRLLTDQGIEAITLASDAAEQAALAEVLNALAGVTTAYEAAQIIEEKLGLRRLAQWMRENPTLALAAVSTGVGGVSLLVTVLSWLYPNPLDRHHPQPPPPAISQHDLREILEEIVRVEVRDEEQRHPDDHPHRQGDEH